MKRSLFFAGVLLAAAAAFAQQSTVTQPIDPAASGEMQTFKDQVQAANPDMRVLSVSGTRQATLEPLPNPKIAVFVKNQTKVAGMDDMVDGVRERLSAELAGAGMIVLDQADIAAAFDRYKVTTAEERAGLVNGLFTGGSVLRVAQMLGADYLMTASIISADRAALTVSGTPMVSYTLRMTVRVSEAVQGSSVYGNNWTRRYPVTAENAAGTDASVYYGDLLDAWASEAGADIAAKARTWRRAEPPAAQLAAVSISTTIDELIQGLESGVRAPNELLDEVRRLVGGATVHIDGAAVGSSPGTFQVTPGLHQLRISRAWMKDWQQTVNIQNGSRFRIAIELSDEGLQRYGALEQLKAQLARDYAEAMARKGVKVNFDTAAWRDVSMFNNGGEAYFPPGGGGGMLPPQQEPAPAPQAK